MLGDIVLAFVGFVFAAIAIFVFAYLAHIVIKG